MWYPLLLVVLIGVVSFAFLTRFRVGRSTSARLVKTGSASRQFQKVRIADRELTVVLASTDAEIEQGLSDRQELGADGMLFVLPRAGQPVFWMYNMQFPLDFVWLRNGKVVDVHTEVSIPTESQPDPQRVQPQQTVTHVLELPAGSIQLLGIQTGDTLETIGNSYQGMW